MGVFTGKWVVAIGIVSILVLVATACGDGDDGTFRIGVMESLTGPGETYGTVGQPGQADGRRRDQ